MEIANSKKFEGTILEKRLPATEKTGLQERRQEGMRALCRIYKVSHEELNNTKKRNPWAKLCMAIIPDVFLGYNQARPSGSPLKRADEYNQHIYTMFKGLKQYCGCNADRAYQVIATYENDRLKQELTKEDIRNVVREAKKTLQENYTPITIDPEIFTRGVSTTEGYNAEDFIILLNSRLKIKQPPMLPAEKDPRNKNLYRAKSSRRQKNSVKI